MFYKTENVPRHVKSIDSPNMIFKSVNLCQIIVIEGLGTKISRLFVTLKNWLLIRLAGAT